MLYTFVVTKKTFFTAHKLVVPAAGGVHVEGHVCLHAVPVVGLPIQPVGEVIGVLGSFFRGGQQFLSAKTQSCSAKKISSQGGAKFYNSVLPS